MRRVTTFTLYLALDHIVKLKSLKVGEVNNITTSFLTPGGKGFRVAMCLADYGYNIVRTGGFVGDENSLFFKRQMIKRGILDFFIPLAGSNRMNTVIVDSSSGKTTNINMPGLKGIKAEQVDNLLKSVNYNEGEIVAIGGSLSSGMDLDTYPRMVKYLRDQGTFVILDTSGKALEAAMSGDVLPHCIKPNLYELSELTNKNLNTLGDILDAVGVLLDKGLNKIIVSLGAKGAVYGEKGSVIYATLPSVATPNSTVGAGDALLAGSIYAWSRGLDLESAARYGLAFAISKLTQSTEYLKAEVIDSWSAKVSSIKVDDKLRGLDIRE